MSVTRSHNLSIGIVGLPNSGKSTIFNALTKSAVPAENYPFCTIDKNVGVVKIPDKRLEKLAAFYNSAEKIPSAMTFVDIAGLVKGASKGEGLGNQFLGHIREVNAIMYVLRSFKSENVTHVYDKINPVDDLKIVRSELMFKDMETVEKKLNEIRKMTKSGMTDDLKIQLSGLEKVSVGLNNEIPVVSIDLTEEEREFVKDLWLLTDKKAFYLLNVKNGVNEPELEQWISDLKKNIPEDECNFILTVDCKLEGELDSYQADDKKEFLSMIDDYKGVEEIIKLAYRRLDLLSFFTGNEKDARSWSIASGATIKEAAGVIHTDFEQNFIRAEVVNVEDMIDSGGWNNAKEKGLVRVEGKEYLIQDGDYILIHSAA
ncbi:redox-regulated ATPase YchF [Candidatus Dojkabacteria bacterium]|nr:redox-regulated ATPase YchF [Candidatus Dojkabacteria bacterium]